MCEEFALTDPRVQKFAQILVDHSAHIVPGDRVLIEATTAAEPLVSALYATILDRGGHPHLELKFPDQETIFFEHAGDAQIDFPPLGFDSKTPVLRDTPLGDIQFGHDFDTGNNR